MELINSYTLIQTSDKDLLQVKDLKSQLETGNDGQKTQAMKAILTSMLNGEALNEMLMHVIRFVMPSKNKSLKKLCVLYWEICQKRVGGVPRPEMVLVCNALRNDLLHPNEYIRGQSLRFLCKLREVDILEPLLPSIRACLDHKHPYVRKNAVLAIFSIHSAYPNLIPDGNELIQLFISTEADQSSRRNCLVMLMNSKLELAVEYYNSVMEHIPNFEPQLQVCFLEIIRKDSSSPGADKAKYIRTVISLLSVQSSSVRYEAAGTLIYLSSHTSAIKAAANCYIELASKEADNNVKLIVLSKLGEMSSKYSSMLEDLVMDILAIISSPDLVVRKTCLALSIELLTSRTVGQVIEFLKKQLVKTSDGEYEQEVEYRQLLIKTIHSCAIAYPLVADSIVLTLMDFLSEGDDSSSVDVIAFVKEVVERFPILRPRILDSLFDCLCVMNHGRTLRGALWIVGEAMALIRESVGAIPIVEFNSDRIDDSSTTPIIPLNIHGGIETSNNGAKRVLADGTYASESVFTTLKPTVDVSSSRQNIRGDFYLCTVLATTLAKLSLRYAKLQSNQSLVNSLNTQAMLIMTSIIRAGKSSSIAVSIDEDSYARITVCLKVLSNYPTDEVMARTFLSDSRAVFAKLLISRMEPRPMKDKSLSDRIESVIAYRLLKPKKDNEARKVDRDFADITRATGVGEEDDAYVSKLDRIYQLSGYSDPVYVEAYVTIHQFDVLLEILIVNQTKETLQNLVVEYSTLGDLKLVEKIGGCSIGPHGFHSVKTNFKVSSTENAAIFGNVVYDDGVTPSSKIIVLKEIRLDVLDYIKPMGCGLESFRKMWDAFEWENKLIVSTPITGLKAYLDFVLRVTNMVSLTPNQDGDCGFLSANLYAQSIFGEDVLANLCLEENSDGVVCGHIRIRSKTQGIALALGEKITLHQKQPQALIEQ